MVFLPIYVRFIGVEGYGVIGFFAVLQGMTLFLDTGLSATVTRALARLATSASDTDEELCLVRTVETLYWMLGGALALVLALSAPYLACYWVRPQNLSQAIVTDAFRLLSVFLLIQWPRGFYLSGLQALQLQGCMNAVISVMATVRGIGTVLVLQYLSPTLDAFILSQIVASAIEIGLLRIFLTKGLPNLKTPRFNISLFRQRGRFAGGLTAVALLGLILSQLDKVVLSKLLSLEDFGFYAMAVLAANSLGLLTAPVFNVVFPEFSRLVERKAESELTTAFHHGAQVLAVLLVPAGVTLALNSWQFMLVWTGSPETADRTFLIISLLAIGTALNGLMNVPLALQLAHGWTGLALRCNAVAVLVMAPATVLLSIRYGAVGAACTWVALNAGYLLAVAHFTHRRLLPLEKWNWYKHGVIAPILAALAAGFLWRMLLPPSLSRFGLLVWLAGAGLMALAASSWAVPVARTWLLQRTQRPGVCRG